MCGDGPNDRLERDAVTELLSGGVPIRRAPLSALYRAWSDGSGVTASR